jgi:hypothetical protein
MGDGAATIQAEKPPGAPCTWPEDGYPPLTASAERAARHGQKRFRQLARTEILPIVAVAALVVAFVLGEDRLWTTESGNRNYLRIVLPVLLSIAFAAKIANRARDYHGRWFAARTITETIKSLTWRYITRANPFEDGPRESEVDQRFEDTIREATRQRSAFEGLVDGAVSPSGQITPAMRWQREQPLEDRRRLYLSARADDQIAWYTQRAERSREMSARWFWGGVVVQAFLLTATLIAVWSLTLAVLIGFFATVSSSNRYARAAEELHYLRATVAAAESDAALSEAVDAAEQAISREHGVWLARR